MIQDTVLTTRETTKRKPESREKTIGQNLETVSQLNGLLADYTVFYQKLLAFHWAVEGNDFFDVHEKLEEDYRRAQEDIDLIAERVRIIGQMPLYTLSDMLKHATLQEAQLPLAAEGMLMQVMRDQEVLVSHLMELVETAREARDLGTEDLAIQMLRRFEKRHWMYRAWLEA
jgi:starvation-inducible DNA-binding protein